MKVLIAFYSLSGVTRKACEKLADKLKENNHEVALEDIIDHKKRTGVIGYIAAGKDAALKKRTEINPPANDPAEFDMIVLAMPVWAFTMPPAIRAYMAIMENKLPEKVAAICTQGGSGDKKTYRDIEEFIGRKLCVTTTFIDKDVKKEIAERFDKPLDDFVKAL